MTLRSRLRWLSPWLLLVPQVAAGDPHVLTQHNDNHRSGAYLSETRLTPANVRPSQFGQLYARHVDGSIVAQPLYVRGVTTRQGPRNVFFVATAQNKVYAFDADDTNPNLNTPPIWSRSLEPPGGQVTCNETRGPVGITSTPVIDLSTQTLYVVTRDGTSGQHFLHALRISDGGDTPGSPVQIAAQASGIAFDTRCHRNRPGLLLLNGVVYVAFATLSCDAGCPSAPYHGWVIGYRTSDLHQISAFVTSAGGGGGAGIWQTGKGLVGADDGTIYFATGNDTIPSPLGNSFLKLAAAASPPGLSLVRHFTPPNFVRLRQCDTDLGSGGPTLLPGGRLIGGGKEGVFYVLDAVTMDPLASFQAFVNSWHNDATQPACCRMDFGSVCNAAVDADTPVHHPTPCVPYAPATTAPGCFLDPVRYQDHEVAGPNIHGGPIYWQGPDPSFGLIYHMPEKDFLKAFRYDLATKSVAPVPFLTASVRPRDGMPGAFLSLSANGNRDGIVWASLPVGDAQWDLKPGLLMAFDASSLQELWRSDGTPGGPLDTPNNPIMWAKSTPPTVADGKVFRATFGDQVIVYGLRPPSYAGTIWQYTGTPCSGDACPGWRRLDNNTKTAAIAAGGGSLYQLHNDGWVWRYTGTACSDDSCPGWERLDNNAKTSALAAAAGQLYQLHNDGWIWRYTGTPCTGEACPGWERLDNNAKTAAIAAGDGGLYQLHNDGWIWRYTGTACTGEACPGWERLDNNSKTVGIAAAGTQLYQLHNDGWIWRYTGTACTGEACPGWERLDNNAKTVGIAAADGSLYQLHNDGWIWQYTGTACTGESCPGWRRLDNNPKTVGIAAAGTQLYQLHNDGWIWRYTGTACTGESCPGWERLDDNARTGAIAAAGDQLYQLHADPLYQRHSTGWIWRYTGPPCTGESCPGWQWLDNNPKTIAVAAADRSLYQLHNDGWIWRYTGVPCSGDSCPGWQRLDNNAKTVAIAAAGNQLFQLHNDGWIWRYTGTPCAGESCPGWQRLDNNAKTRAIVAAGDHLYQLHSDGWIWKYLGVPCVDDACGGWERLDNNRKTQNILVEGLNR